MNSSIMGSDDFACKAQHGWAKWPDSRAMSPRSALIAGSACMSVRYCTSLLVLATVAASSARAQGDAARSFPLKPIRVVVGYAAGGGNDIVVRLLAPKLTERLGQPVIVDNRPGAQSIIAAELVARANADGYTLLMGPSGPMSMNPAIYSKLPYLPQRDFAPITMIGSFPLMLVVSPTLQVQSVKALIEYAKARPDKVNYGASAAPFQLASELFNQKTGTRFAHISYKGSNESITAVIANQVTMTITDPPPAVGQIKTGRLRALAVTAATRHAAWPELPTLMESGIPDIEVVLWNGFLAPAATPRAVVSRLHEETVRVIRLPEVGERLAGIGIDAVGSTPEEYARVIGKDIAKWTAVARASNIRAD
jgi:tripartite-type tricarboxylate transporter receptor subunit TctC